MAGTKRSKAKDAGHKSLDKTLFELNTDAFAKFQKVLDAPAAPSNKLRRFLTGKSPWDRR